MINIDMINTIKQRVEYSRDLDNEAIRTVLDIIEQVEADVLDLLEGAVEHEEALGLAESTDLDFKGFDKEDVIDWGNFKGSKEDSLDENFKPKRDPNFYAMDQFNFAE